MLKAALQNHLRDNGVIHSITAQFRRHIVDELLVNRKLTGNIESGSEDDGTNITEICKKKILVARNNLSLEDVAFHSLVMAFLIQENLQHTLSVYKFECGVRKKPLSEEECFQALGIQPNSTSFQRIFSHKEKSYKIEKTTKKSKGGLSCEE